MDLFLDFFLSFFLSPTPLIYIAVLVPNTRVLITVALKLGSVSPPLCSLSRLFSLFCVPYIST